ncbi:MAG: T9SS type A sorting domain-containing protein [Bacteroidales bacterium]|nr:T9SS type A sorting domain-containing protein [Bacteroidales bacterium]
MKTTITLLMIIISAVVLAQPEITEANLPHVGDHVVIAICSNPVDAGESGANITWDMSGLSEQEEQFFDYIAMTEAPRADSFPNANICGVSWLDDFSNYKHSSEGLTAEGYVVTSDAIDTTLMVFSNSEKIIELPFSYGDSFMDEFDGNSYVPGIGVFPFDGSISFEADGYGTLILPTGTYNNVVRYHFTREQTNYLNGIPANTQTKEQWGWVSEDFRFWLLLMETNFDGFSTSSLIWYDKNPFPASTGIASTNFNAEHIYPNPLKQDQLLNIKWDKAENTTISILSLDGRLVYREQMHLQNGVNPIPFNINNEGLYMLSIRGENSLKSAKIMIQK